MQDWPELCTFFEAEVIGPKHSFLTRKWGADEKTDREHWVRRTCKTVPTILTFIFIFSQNSMDLKSMRHISTMITSSTTFNQMILYLCDGR